MNFINAFFNVEHAKMFFDYSSISDADIRILRDYYKNDAAFPPHILEQVEIIEREQKEMHRISQMMRDAMNKITYNRPINNWLMLDEVRKNKLITFAKRISYKEIKLKEYPFKYIIE